MQKNTVHNIAKFVIYFTTNFGKKRIENELMNSQSML